MSAAIVLVVSLSGCYQTETGEAVFIIGDSLGMQFQSVLSTRIQLRDNAPLVMTNSIGGMAAAYNNSNEYWTGRIREVQKITNLNVLIVSLGTNDGTLYAATGTGSDLYAQFPNAIDSIVESAQGVPVYWVIPSNKSGMRHKRKIRNMLYEAKAIHPNLTLVEVVENGLAEDNVHLSQVGETAINDQIMVLLGYE